MPGDMYDYLLPVAPDYAAFLSVDPQEVIEEDGSKNQIVHSADDGSEEYISLADDSIFYVTLQWPHLVNRADSAAIFDMYHDAAKANGIVRTFKWANPDDNHTYVVRFTDKLPRSIRKHTHGLKIRLRILGRVNDV